MKRKFPCVQKTVVHKLVHNKNNAHFGNGDHKCIKCGKNYTRKSSLQRHLKNSKCQKTLDNLHNLDGAKCANRIILESQQNHLESFSDELESQMTHFAPNDNLNAPENHKMCKKLVKNNENMEISDSKMCKKLVKSPYMCEFCGKSFSRNSNWNRHVKNFCKAKRKYDKSVHEEMDQLKSEILMLQEKYEELDGKNSSYANHSHNANHSNNTNTQTQTNSHNKTINNYNIYHFGKEDMSHISDSHYKAILSTGFMAVPHLINKTHFSKNISHNHNVFISNLRSKFARIYDGKNWVVSDRTEVINKLYEDKRDILESKFGELTDEMTTFANDRFRRFLSKNESDSEIQNVKNDITKMLYNKREIPIDTIRDQ